MKRSTGQLLLIGCLGLTAALWWSLREPGDGGAGSGDESSDVAGTEASDAAKEAMEADAEELGDAAEGEPEQDLLGQMVRGGGASITFEEMMVEERPLEDAMKGSSDLDSEGAFSDALAQDPAVVGSRMVRFDRSLFEVAIGLEDGANQEIEYELLEGVRVALRPRDHKRLSEIRGVLSGEIVGAEGGAFVLAYNGEVEAGFIRVPGRGEFRVRYMGEGVHQIAEIDGRLVPPCGTGEHF